MLIHLCLLDAIVEVHSTDEKMFNDFLIGRSKWNIYVMNASLI